MQSTDDIFDAFGGPAQVGKAIGVTTEHASAMKRRGSIPAAYWGALIAEGAKRKVAITYAHLSRIARERKSAQPLPVLHAGEAR